MIRLLVVLALVPLSSLQFPPPKNNFVNRGASCGYQSCAPTRPGMLNVHIICHTHLDAGWTQTYDEYYHRYVRVIYDSVVETLYEKPNRKFIAVETSFFSRWFNDSPETIKNRVAWLVRTGQLEFISGGWSMSDEAATNYQDLIDQMTLGHQWLNETFGECGIPKIGWQIDPFGHSREVASMASQMAFDGLFLGRIDYQDKLLRERTQTLEMIWKASPSLGAKADIFTGVLPNVYWPPTGFCFDVNCMDEPVHEFNQDQKAREFIRHVRKQSAMYATNHTVITMGMDFYFRDAGKWFTNLDKLMEAINRIANEEGVHMLYSTPSCYLKSLHESRKLWPVKLDDFFPYADQYNAYWTGYFTSRPSLKLNIRYGNNVLQVAKQLHALALMPESASHKIRPLREAMGILQHHDAATGTCRQYVADDYVNMITKAITVAEEAIVDAYDKLWVREGFLPTSSLVFCNQLNISSCDATETLDATNDVVLIIYNPLAHAVKHYARVPVRGRGHRVRDSLGAVSPSQIIPNHEAVLALPGRTRSPAEAELVFRVMLPPLGFTSIAIDRPEPSGAPSVPNQVSQVFDGANFHDEITITNGRVSAVVDARSGLLSAVVMRDGRRVPIQQNFFIYDAETRKTGEKPSGAYAFNPGPQKPRPSTIKATVKVIRGLLVEEIHQSFNPWISQVIRIYQHVDYIECDWVVGPIPVDNWFFDPGQEVVSKFDTFLRTNGSFFTDANGRETIRRQRDSRPTWDLDTSERVASNYYPVTSWMFIRDYEKDLQLTILPDRPEGGSSMDDGSLELMVHRRLTMDDGYGMDEALNEPGEDGRGLVVRGRHRIIVNDIKESIRQMRIMSKSLNLKPLIAFKKRNLARPIRNPAQRAQRQLDSSKFVGLNKKLPPNLHLLTLEPWTDGRILVRLEHLFEINEDPKYSKPRRISLRDLFAPFIVVNVEEMTLSANQWKRPAEERRLKWTPEVNPYANYTNVLTQLDTDDLEPINAATAPGANEPFFVTMFPMEIRTFLLNVQERKNCAYQNPNFPRRGSNLRPPNC